MSTTPDENKNVSTVSEVLNPFPGLRPFKIEESHLFFGREGQSDEVLLKLSKSRFVGVIGPSGSGKSSFIYCGVLPILYGGFLTDASPNWEVVVTRPGAGPIDNLAESLLKTTQEYNYADPDEKRIKRTIVSTLLRSSSLGLVEAIEQSRKRADVNYLVLVDQFEELFRFKDGADPNSINETLGFVNLLMEAVNYPDAPIYVAITMRSDFIGDCAQFPELTRKINDSHYLIPQMTREQKRRAIEGPVAVGGAKIAPRLTQQLLNDLGDNPDQLPILQHALMRTWGYWQRYKDYDDEPVDLKHYEAIGTMSEALSMHANEAYDELDEDQKRVCEVMFKAITEKRGENFGIRRPTRLNEIASIADVSENEVIAVIEKFREPGRSLLTPGYGLPLGSRSMIDISHESLMRIWVRLKNWVDDEADAVQMYLRLAEASSMYQIGKAGLWRPPDLQLALNWQVKHKPTLVWGQRYHPAFERTMIFLEYSKKEFETEQRIKELEQKRKLQRARIAALVMGAFTIVALIAMVYAFVQQTFADKARVEAEAQKTEAIKQAKRADDQAARANLEAENAKKQQKIAEQERIRAQQNEAAAVSAKQLAEEQRQRAIENERLAQLNENKAKTQQKLAEENEKKAKVEEEKARRERYLALGKAMAVKSKELNNDPQLEALIAQQAYNFNTRFNGYAYDGDVYNGLYSALKNQATPDPITLNLSGHDKGACRALVSRTRSNQIYSGGSDGRILRWTEKDKVWVSEELVDLSDYLIYTLDVSPDDNWLVAGGATMGDATKNYILLWDLRNMSAGPKKIGGFTQNIEDVVFSAKDKGVYVRDNAGRSIKFTDLTNVKEVLKPAEKINSITMNRDGSRLAGVGESGSLYLWDTGASFAEKILYKNKTALTTITFAYDGKRIIVGDANGLVMILSESAPTPRILSGHTAHIEQIRFNNAGTFLATVSRDKTIRLWNWADLNKQPIVLSGHTDWVWSAAFTPDDEQLLVGMHSNSEHSKETIHAWPTKITTMAGLLCQYVSANLSLDEWETYVGPVNDIPQEKTCPNFPLNNK
ncbi:MAG: High-affnity carbon uptake protein Hat/HatR [Cyclobacteriaceae bacterium]|nr:High-affnity carbon uptake protein Hat/HatR [Cyclobacteriaceae bacterium]